MDFIKEITEARMTRTESNTRRLSYRDCCERAYLILLGLEMMRKFPQYSAEARKYARNTSRFANYDSFRASATDLYNFIYFIVGDDAAMQKLRDPEDAKDVREKTTLPQMAVNRYLSKIAQGQEPTASSEMFIKLESVLRINSSNYKRIRRTVTNLNRANSRDIREAATKLLYAARARLRSSDFIQPLEALAADKDLETIELSQQGKTIPSNVARAFDPAIEILVDIVKGGPTYVSRLLQLQKNAKRTRKRR